MKKALQVLVFPTVVALLFGSSAVLSGPGKSSMALLDVAGGPTAPGTPDSPMCLPDSPCPEVPNFR